MKKQDKIIKIIKILRKLYPIKTALKYRSTYQLLVATILSAQCTDKNVNKVTPFIFNKYKNVFGFAKAKHLEREIKSVGLYRAKAKNIINMSKKIIKDFNGKVPNSMEKLVQLPGVARKTANIILSHCFNKKQGIAVDTHVKRLSFRIGFTKEKNPVKIEQDLMKIVPRRYWGIFNTLLVYHGRTVCKAKKFNCKLCKINRFCKRVIF